MRTRTLALLAVLTTWACGPSLRPTARLSSDPQKFATSKAVDRATEKHRREEIAKVLPDLKEFVDEEAKAFPSLTIGVIVAEDLVWSSSYGARDDVMKDPVTPDTIFRIGSLTKVMTGAALLALRDAGKVSFDEPLVRMLPELATIVYPTSDSPLITLRHIVTHSSGMSRDGRLDMAPSTPLTDEQVLAAAAHEQLIFSPGTQTSYSNVAMALAGVVIERASHMPFAAYMAKKLFGPIGMSSTFWDKSQVPAERLATGHILDRTGVHAGAAHFRLGAAGAMGGLYSSLNDLAKFVSFELTAWPPRNGPDDGPLRRATLRESQLAFGPVRAGTVFGVNWIVIDDKELGYVLFHNGSTGDYSATVWLAPSRQIGVVALAGSGNYGALDSLGHKVLGIVASAAPEPPPVLGEPVSVALIRVLALLSKAEVADIKLAFTPKFLTNVTAEQVKDTFEKISRVFGKCANHHAVQVTAAYAAIVRLECEKGVVDLHLETTPDSPYLLELLELQPVQGQGAPSVP